MLLALTITEENVVHVDDDDPHDAYVSATIWLETRHSAAPPTLASLLAADMHRLRRPAADLETSDVGDKGAEASATAAASSRGSPQTNASSAIPLWPLRVDTKPLTAEVVLKGDTLRWCIEHYLNIAHTPEETHRLMHLPDEVRHASACIGTGMDGVCLEELLSALQQRGVQSRARCLFDCDVDATKRAFVKHTRKLDETSDQCCFVDIEHICDSEEAPCDVHGHMPQPKKRAKKTSARPPPLRPCSVRRPMIWTCCTSCKYLSPMNSSRRDGPANQLFASGTSSHCSMTTYAAHIRFVDKHRPDFVFFENSDSLADESTGQEIQSVASNIHTIIWDLESRGYAAHS